MASNENDGEIVRSVSASRNGVLPSRVRSASSLFRGKSEAGARNETDSSDESGAFEIFQKKNIVFLDEMRNFIVIQSS